MAPLLPRATALLRPARLPLLAGRALGRRPTRLPLATRLALVTRLPPGPGLLPGRGACGTLLIDIRPGLWSPRVTLARLRSGRIAHVLPFGLLTSPAA